MFLFYFTLLFYLVRDCIRSEKMDLLLAICREEEKSQSVDNQLFLSSSFALVSTEYEEIVIMIVEKGNLNWWQLEIARKIIYGIACISWINVARHCIIISALMMMQPIVKMTMIMMIIIIMILTMRMRIRMLIIYEEHFGQCSGRVQGSLLAKTS